MRTFILCNLQVYYNNQIRQDEMGWVGHITHMRVNRNVYTVLVGKLEVKGLLGKPMHIC
jgi:hypothetical protein